MLQVELENIKESLPEDKNRLTTYTNHGAKYDVISKVAFLIGVPESIFRNSSEPPLLSVYEDLRNRKEARIMRNLNILRSDLENNFGKILNQIKFEYKTIATSSYMDKYALEELNQDGVWVYKDLESPNKFMFLLNREIKNRIHTCRSLFKDWLNWDYIQDLFIMPNGETEEGIKAAGEIFYDNYKAYPYQRWINWKPRSQGNILFTDKLFVTLLYEQHDDKFKDYSMVSDVSNEIKDSVHDFIDAGENIVFVVDCENSDPYNLCAAINGLDEDRISKIKSIILYDDVHAASAWESLASYINIPVDYVLIERLKDNKSLADIRVSARICEEFYKNGVDSIILVSSDSDYWGLIQSLPEAKFFVMIEREKSASVLRRTLVDNKIRYCYIDDFYSDGFEEIKLNAIHKELSSILKNALNLNIIGAMKEVLIRTRIPMDDEQLMNFIKSKVTKSLSLEMSDDGDLFVALS